MLLTVDADPMWIDAKLLGALILALATLHLFLTYEDQKRCGWLILVALLAVPFSVACQFAALMLSAVRPWKYDYLAFHVDALIGFQPSFVVGHAFLRWHWLLLVSTFVYHSLTLGPVLVFGSYLWLRSIEEAFAALRMMLIAAIAAIPIYLFVPVCGPYYAFPGFPFSLPGKPIGFEAIQLSAAPNAIPSVHLTTALLVAWYARHWSLGKVLGLAFLLFTALGTLGLGQHYAIDLVLAIPYTIACWQLGRLRWLTLRPTPVRNAQLPEAAPSSSSTRTASTRLTPRPAFESTQGDNS